MKRYVLKNPAKQKSNRTLPPAEYTSRFFQTERLAPNPSAGTDK
jgi:hypothetical protein